MKWSVRPLANEFVSIYESPDPKNIYCYSPGIVRLDTGRLVATCDLGGPGVKKLPGTKSASGDFGQPNQGKVFISDDRGATWRHVADFPFLHARPFTADKALYILGEDGDICIIRSDDDGETWSETARLTNGEVWHQAPCNVHYAKGKIYLVMETRTGPGEWCEKLAPVLLSAPCDSNLLKRESWTFSNKISFTETVRTPKMIGVPFYKKGPVADEFPEGTDRYNAPAGWLETNVLQFTDPSHLWHDPEGRTFHMLARAHTGSTNMACLLKAREDASGQLTVSLENAPSGEPMAYVPCPGGQMKFHILHDDATRLFWLLSTQSTDSMTHPELLSKDRYGLPNNERHRLQLHFSKNAIDWCFACMVAIGPSDKESRHYASMCIDGDDLCIVSRSGDKRAKSAHNGNLISFHKITKFRDLVY